MSGQKSGGVIVEWNGGKATGFASKKDAERFIKLVCRKLAPKLDYYIYSTTGPESGKKKGIRV